MITDLINPYIFKILITTSSKSIWGGCTIFKASISSEKCYLITAKHNIFPDGKNSEHTDTPFDISHLVIEVHNEGENKETIIPFKNSAFFFKNEERLETLDLALIIIQNPLKHINELKIYDTDDEKQDTHIYYTAGYPKYLESENIDHMCEFYRLKPISKHKNNIEQVVNPDGSINFTENDFVDNLRLFGNSRGEPQDIVLGKSRSSYSRS